MYLNKKKNTIFFFQFPISFSVNFIEPVGLRLAAQQRLVHQIKQPEASATEDLRVLAKGASRLIPVQVSVTCQIHFVLEQQFFQASEGRVK